MNDVWNMPIWDDLSLTPREQEALALLREGLTNQQIAKELNVTDTTIRGFAHQMRAKAASVERTTIQKNEQGQTVRSWIKNKYSSEERQQVQRATIEALKEELTPYPAIEYTGHKNENLLNCYIVTDYHLGMLAHKEETHDADWDLKKSEELLSNWFDSAIESSPNASTAILANIGDFLHWDGLEAVTPTSKHVLDADSRFHKVVRAAIKQLRRIIARLLSKHWKVHVVMADANHDPASEVWLRELLAAVYEDNPRVTVDQNPNPYNCYKFGKVALYFHHGHKRKIAEVDRVFAGMYPEIFGATQYRYAHLGHLHSKDMKESQLMVAEQHRTLSPSDAYAARGGWLSGRSAPVITYHKDFGEVGRQTITPEMVK